MNTEKAVKETSHDRIYKEIRFCAYETFCTAGIAPEAGAGQILEECRRRALKVQAVLNIYDPQAELSVLCQSYKAGRPCRVSPLLFSFLEMNLWLAARSMGGFDPTLGPVILLWEQCGKEGRLPMEAELKAAMARTGWEHIHLKKENLEVIIDLPGMVIHPGASGKGFALDVVADYLKGQGVRDGYLDFGGNLYALGTHSFRAGIRHPQNPSRIMAVLPVKNQALSTSSWYEHYFEKDGKIYSHILRPADGQPVASELVSVSCLSLSAVVGDMLSTTFYVLGKNKGQSVAKALEAQIGQPIGYVALDADGKLWRR